MAKPLLSAHPVAPPPSPGQAALTAALQKGGPGFEGYVYDLDAGSALVDLGAGGMRPPASVEKVYTTVAALTDLAPTATLQTTVLGAGSLGPGGVWHGNLYLRGGGDPTFGDEAFNKAWEQGNGPTANQLVAQLAGQGIRSVTGTVIADQSLMDPYPGGPASAYGPDVGDYEGQLSALTFDHGATTGSLGPAQFAVKQVVATMNAQHIAARTDLSLGVTPASARRLAVVDSPPLTTLLRLMDVPSDDLFADLLAKQLGARLAGSGTFTAGAGVITRAINGYDVHPTIVDGSGLSRSDRTSPLQVVALLRALWHTTVGGELAASLPIVGVSGTVATIGVRTPAQGRCVAKTGTLNQVTNLAGYCHSLDGHTLAFALFNDGPENWTALKQYGGMVAAIASY